MPPLHPPTPEQQAILDAALADRRSIMIDALAGCTKTTILQMLAAALPQEPSLALAFNVKIKKELEARFPSHFEIKTLNGLGHSAWQRAIGKRLTLDDRKLGKLVTEHIKLSGNEVSQDEWDQLRRLVTAAMQVGIVPASRPHQGLTSDTFTNWADLAIDQLMLQPPVWFLEIARGVLKASVDLSFEGTISFDDQIYMPTLFNGVFPRFPLVMVDEAQDLSPLNHIMVKKCAADRLIVVGDPKQAIYGFRGADSSSMENMLKLRKEWVRLPLYLTFRCPSVVVARQQDHAPGYRAAPSNAEGQWLSWPKGAPAVGDVMAPGEPSPMWTWERDLSPATGAGTVAILCRNNGPLLSLAFKLIRQGVGCVMLGRDIGKGLVALSKKLLPHNNTPTTECAELIEAWREHETQLARVNEREDKVAAVEDRAACLFAVLESGMCKTSGELRTKLEALFSRDTGRVTLVSIHRSKGLEWDCVLHLDPWRIPSKYARAAAARGDRTQLQQELNLRYVCETRTKHTLISANLEDFQ